MRAGLLSVLIVCLVATASGQTGKSAAAAGSPATTIELKEPTFNFGKIPQGRPVTHDFEVINRSKQPLILEAVQASCGCTTPQWSELPIPSGGSSIIKVGFNAAAEGPFSKVISITYNGGQSKTFTISGEVYPSPTTSAPPNASLSLLK